MKLQVLIIVLCIVWLQACGGSSGGDLAPIQGTWRGIVAYDSNSCGPVELLPNNISGSSFQVTIFDSPSEAGYCPIKAVDQDNRSYLLNEGEECQIESIEEFLFTAEAETTGVLNGGGLLFPNNPTGIVFSNVSDTTAEVAIVYFVDRFCRFVFRGTFTRG